VRNSSFIFRFNILHLLVAIAALAIVFWMLLWVDIFPDGVWVVDSIESIRVSSAECLRQGVQSTNDCRLDLAECFDGRKRITIVLGETAEREALLSRLDVGDSFVFIDAIDQNRVSDSVIQLPNHMVRVLPK
jgi:hypothetical protein